MAIVAGAVLGLDLPRTDKRLLVIAETDGCFIDGLEAAAGVSPGHRTLRIEDYGKVAATFVDVRTEQAFRLAPRPDVRSCAGLYAPEEKRRYFAQLRAYQVMPEEELFSVQPVALAVPVQEIVSRAGLRVNCSICAEEIINEREIWEKGLPYCRSCYGVGYWVQAGSLAASVLPGVLLAPTMLEKD